jgi:two-component system, OmpR family, sensor histidine kinase SenX3
MRRKLTQRPFWVLSLALAMLALLPLLAVKQYFWLGQVSEGERERKKSVLTTMARQFCHEFDSELTALYFYFQPTPIPVDGKSDKSRSDQSRDDFTATYRRWRETAPHPKLIKAVYQTQAGENGEGFSQYNPETGAFELCEWPYGMTNLRKRLAEERAGGELLRAQLRESIKLTKNLRSESGSRKVESGSQKMVFQLALNCVDADLPGLLIPISDRREDEVMPLLGPRSYRIIAFDVDYIGGELIPELARRHFGDSAGEYTIAVTKRGKTDQLVYRSDAGVPEAALASGDVTDGLFKIRFDETDRLFFTHWRRQDLGASSGVAVKLKRPEGHQQIEVRVAGDYKFSRNENAATPQRTPLEPITESITRSLLRRNDEGAWRLVVKHRAGSLEAAVTSARRRNLAISFGVLFLLSASVGFIVLSSRRAQRLATQQMEFVAGVSHELRTPLAVICSAAENLADGVIDNRDQIKRYGGLIRDEGRRLSGMVEQVLEFAGAQSGRKNYELRTTDLSQVIEDAITACHLQLSEGGFEIERKIAPDLPMVKADAAALSRAIQNLLSNAMKYSGDSRWIGLNAESVKTASGEEVQIKVSDLGLGIAPSEQERIFEPFYRGKEAQTAQIRGNGLGLSLVKHIIATHGGRVSVESKVGQGSVFILYLPILAAAESQVETTSEYDVQTQFKTSQLR